VGNTLYFTIASVTLELLLGLFIAMVINSKFSGRGLMRAAMLVPWAIPTVISARLWEIMLRDNQSGVINNFLVAIGLLERSQAWLANPDLQIPAMIMIDAWKTTPFMALILLAGLQVIPSDIYEAADVDGASKARQFFTITLPLLRPAVAVALVFRTLDAIRVFDVFQLLLGRAKLSMATYNYEVLVSNQELGYASAIGVIIYVIIFIFAMGYVKILGVSTE
jgi:trehalose/maltose transport system permease protein